MSETHLVSNRGRSAQPFSPHSLHKAPRTEGATVTESVCPYCAVGCGLLVYTKGGQIIDIEGNPRSPINEGTLCPKGANSFQLAVNPHRITEVLYRAPYSDQWETRPLDWAVEKIASRVKETRDAELAVLSAGGQRSDENREGSKTPSRAIKSFGTLGGATLDNEENYLIKKLFGAGLGVVSIENQARI